MSDPTGGWGQGAGSNQPAPLTADERTQFEAYQDAEAARKADADAERQRITDAELAAFREFQAAQQAEADKVATAKAQAEEEAAAAEEEANRRAAEDKALCPHCAAPRNNPSRRGHPDQEYLVYCWACGYGNGQGQTYPDVAA